MCIPVRAQVAREEILNLGLDVLALNLLLDLDSLLGLRADGAETRFVLPLALILGSSLTNAHQTLEHDVSRGATLVLLEVVLIVHNLVITDDLHFVTSLSHALKKSQN